MNKEGYFKKSKCERLPNRCPILKYCERRAFTIYFFAEYYKDDRYHNPIEMLIINGEVTEDFEEKRIAIQGEPPEWKKSEIQIFYHNMCPEVNLFDTENAFSFAKGTASTDGEWDGVRNEFENKNIHEFENKNYKHYSECSEFSKYYFDNKDLKLKNSTCGIIKKPRIGISKILRFEVFQRDNFTCQYCGKTKDDKVKFEIDHVVPISKGGTDEFSNLVTSCSDCNQGKSNKII